MVNPPGESAGVSKSEFAIEMIAVHPALVPKISATAISIAAHNQFLEKFLRILQYIKLLFIFGLLNVKNYRLKFAAILLNPVDF